MADNYEAFLIALEVISEELEAAIGNSDCTVEEFGLSNPEQWNHYIELRSSPEMGINSSTNIVSLEKEFAFPHSTQFSAQCHTISVDVSHSESLVGAEKSVSEASEENTVYSFISPDKKSESELRRSNGSPFNSSENSKETKSLLIENEKILLAPCPRTKVPGVVHLHGDRNSSFDLKSAPLSYIEGYRNNIEIKKSKNQKPMKSVSAEVTHSDDSSSIEMTTHDAAMVPIARAEAISIAGPSLIPSQSHRSGKDKQFVCEVCGKEFGYKHVLHTHLRTHTGEKPLKCFACGRRFAQKSHLTTHLLIHNGEKPFECDFCRRGFTKKINLDHHLRTHTGEKPFKCRWCGIGFSQKRNCTRHEKGTHGRK